MKNKHLIFIIVFAEFAGTSLWFGSNAVIGPMGEALSISNNSFGYITSSVQFGFIIGTLVYAVFGIADRFSPSKVFFWSSILGAFFNALICLIATDLMSLLMIRSFTGFFLAGIYPVGMKIAADWFAKDLSKALGFLVGALVLGTAFPHLLSSTLSAWPWQYVLYTSSGLSCLGAVAILLFVSDGPHRKKNKKFSLKGLWLLRKEKKLMGAAIGYFGHMWELYAFWAFVPVILATQAETKTHPTSLFTFFIIASGALSCILGGYYAKKIGSEKVAFYALATSAVCCVFYPIFFELDPIIFFLFMIIWGMAVIADSPQLSTAVASYSPADNLGSTLTIINCIGFSITILSIQLINSLIDTIQVRYLFAILALGPILSLLSLKKLFKLKQLAS